MVPVLCFEIYELNMQSILCKLFIDYAIDFQFFLFRICADSTNLRSVFLGDAFSGNLLTIHQDHFKM